jgi:glycosyltransferase involved in cell wall biosynthesis
MTERAGDQRVSVVMAVRNGERFLGEALESILAQTHPVHEVIVVDGASSDRSREIARTFERVRVLEQDGLGLAGAWNQAIAASEGELIAFLDSDDRWLPHKTERQLELLAGRPAAAAAIARARFFLEPGHEPPPGFRPALLEGDYVAPMPGTWLLRREVFDRVGLFNPEFLVGLDGDWWARFLDSGSRIENLEEVVVEKRVHEANLSHSLPDRYRHEMTRLLRESIARKREKGAG